MPAQVPAQVTAQEQAQVPAQVLPAAPAASAAASAVSINMSTKPCRACAVIILLQLLLKLLLKLLPPSQFPPENVPKQMCLNKMCIDKNQLRFDKKPSIKSVLKKMLDLRHGRGFWGQPVRPARHPRLRPKSTFFVCFRQFACKYAFSLNRACALPPVSHLKVRPPISRR